MHSRPGDQCGPVGGTGSEEPGVNEFTHTVDEHLPRRGVVRLRWWLLAWRNAVSNRCGSASANST